ncbi:MAG: nucleotidyltransferase family protein [Acidimicrobiia bacterium]
MTDPAPDVARRPLLVAAMIVRDEEAHLDRCLTSLRDLVDAVVVVDTGSVDDTVAIAHRHGAIVDHMTWAGEFAPPRNRALDLADAEWILYIDADEEIVDTDPVAFRALLEAADDCMCFRVRFIPRVGWTPYVEYRVWRQRPEIRFGGVIHESMVGPIHAAADREGRTVEVSDGLTIQHHGYEGDQRHKYERDEPLLLRQLELAPDRIFLYDHLARIYEGLGDSPRAVATWKRGIDAVRIAPVPTHDDRLVYIDLIFHLIAQGDTGDELAAIVDEALVRFPGVPTLEYGAAVVQFARGDAAGAAERVERVLALSLDDIVATGSSYDGRLFDEWAWNLLGLSPLALGEDAAAAVAFAHAEQAEPGQRRVPHPPAARGVRAAAAAGEPRRLLEVAEILRPESGVPRRATGGLARAARRRRRARTPARCGRHWSPPGCGRCRRTCAPVRRGSRLRQLEDAHLANAARVADLRAQGVALLHALRTAGIAALPLKGLHGMLAGWWRDPAARVMVDVDLLVEPAHIDDAAEVAAGLGYHDLGTLDPEGLAAHQRPALGLPDHLGSVELHVAPLVVRRASLLPTAELFAAAAPGPAVPTLPVPSATHAAVLAIAHAQLQDDGARLLHVPLRALYDVASMHAPGALAAVDWDEVQRRFAQLRAHRASPGSRSLGADVRGGASRCLPRWGRVVARRRWADDHRTAAQRYREP